VNSHTNLTGIPAALTGWLRASLLVLCLALTVPAALAQAPEPPVDPTPAIQTPPPQASDAEIKTRISDIFAEIATLRRVTVEVNHGVVTLGRRSGQQCCRDPRRGDCPAREWRRHG
jgi:small conductance mechanosensitive channel